MIKFVLSKNLYWFTSFPQTSSNSYQAFRGHAYYNKVCPFVYFYYSHLFHKQVLIVFKYLCVLICMWYRYELHKIGSTLPMVHASRNPCKCYDSLLSTWTLGVENCGDYCPLGSSLADFMITRVWKYKRSTPHQLHGRPSGSVRILSWRSKRVTGVGPLFRVRRVARKRRSNGLWIAPVGTR